MWRFSKVHVSLWWMFFFFSNNINLSNCFCLHYANFPIVYRFSWHRKDHDNLSSGISPFEWRLS